MNFCEHKISGSREKIWLTYYYEGRNRGLKPHPYCAECGLVKNLSSDRPRNAGYYMNIVAAVGKHYKIAQVQVRLIVMEIEKIELADAYGMDRQSQDKLFIEIVTRILNVPEREIRALLQT